LIRSCWRDAVDVNGSDERVRHSLLQYLLDLARKIGTSPADGIEPGSAASGRRLYSLMFVSANPLGLRPWIDIGSVDLTPGQTPETRVTC
jgi:hypothetical protein